VRDTDPPCCKRCYDKGVTLTHCGEGGGPGHRMSRCSVLNKETVYNAGIVSFRIRNCSIYFNIIHTSIKRRYLYSAIKVLRGRGAYGVKQD